MCGIAGFFDLRSRCVRPDADATLVRQITTFKYRGPDASGVCSGPGYGLAHARLSIIDVSSSANQPFFDNSRNVVTVFNGEIYNFQEIRSVLIAAGHVFRTNSDTEVIVEGYARWGEKVVDRLRGMFAIAIYDVSKDRLILMRDRVGKKPLYYSVIGDTLVFASEIKGILAFPGAPRVPHLEAIHHYLTYQYVPSPLTAFVGIHKLPASHMVIADRGKAPSISSYYAFPSPGPGKARSPSEAAEELIHHLTEATRLRMIADVPLGAFLSGGVDSSSVVAMMATGSSSPVNTFTIGFDEQGYDERRYARMVAQRYGTNHRDFTVRPDAMAVLPALVYHYGEPFADSSAIPTYYVSKIAREHVTVILSGDGADESFFGYARYQLCRDKQSQLPRTSSSPGVRQPLFGRVMRALLGASGTAVSRYSRLYEQSIAYFTDDSKRELYAGDFRRFLDHSSLDRLDRYFDASQSMAEGAAWADVHTYLPDDLLVKVDVASMANSLEVRSPFLDHKLMEWAATVPEGQRFATGETKSLLKASMEPYLPHELLYRPKMGFGVPIEHWLRKQMREFVHETLLGSKALGRGLFDPEAVRSLIARHNSGENWAIRIWALLMLELWFEMWIDDEPPRSPPPSVRQGNA